MSTIVCSECSGRFASTAPSCPHCALVAYDIPEFAALCRERCSRPSQGHPDLTCGQTSTHDGEPTFTFCGRHWGAVL